MMSRINTDMLKEMALCLGITIEESAGFDNNWQSVLLAASSLRNRVDFLKDQVKKTTNAAWYWKQEVLAGNEEIAKLQTELLKHETAMRFCGENSTKYEDDLSCTK